MSKLSKVIIPVAGLGTRVLPASKAIPKEMMPVVDKPVIQHVVEEAVSAGLTEIILVTRSGKSAIEDHFDSHYELESELKRKGKTAILESVRNIVPEGVTISSVRQHSALGLGHAVLAAASITQHEDFAVMLPDVLIPAKAGEDSCDMQKMVAAYKESGTGQIMVEAVPDEIVDRYGIVDCAGDNPDKGSSSNITQMVEKPPIDQAPSNLSINGRYILPARVMELLTETKPGAGNEIQLTDAMANYLKEGKLQAFHMHGRSYDCGNKAGYLEANITLGLQHPETAEQLKKFISSL